MQLIASTLFQDSTPVANQLHRHGLRGILNDPEALIAKLTAWGQEVGHAACAPKGALAPVEAVIAEMPPMAADGQFLMEF